MLVSTTSDPIIALTAQVCWQPTTPVRLWQSLSDAWLHRMERRVAADIRALDHAGVLEDYRSASRG